VPGEGRACPIYEVDEVCRSRCRMMCVYVSICREGEEMVETEGTISNQVRKQILSTWRNTLIFRK
jgi:hypothetical protein